MSVRDSRWLRLRRRLGPVTRRVPYGHVVTESATYARLLMPGLNVPRRRFVIFAQGRSGSTLLADLLNSHPQVYCADEILTWKRADPLRYARACSVGHRGDTYGFKLKIYHLNEGQGIVDAGAWLRRLHAGGWAVIALQRRNVLRQALSSLVAQQRRQYHVEGASNGSAQPVVVDAADLLRRTEARVAMCAREQQALAGIPHLALHYEDDLLHPDNHQRTADRVFDYLGLPPVTVSTGLRKIADGGLDTVVANAAEITTAVAASPYAALLTRE